MPLEDLISDARVAGDTLELRFSIRQLGVLIGSLVMTASLTIGAVWLTTRDLAFEVKRLAQSVTQQSETLDKLQTTVTNNRLDNILQNQRLNYLERFHERHEGRPTSKR